MTTYQAIAAEIRRRIETGRLRPGDRVPSTRAITRQWGVAVATATKALQALQAEGLVRGVVGVGTVVADRPRRIAPAGDHAASPQGTVARRRRAVRDTEPELTRDRIVHAAVALADAEGLPAVTMRRLAVELDVAVMSLYRHVASKDDLLVLMVDHAMGETPLPDPPPGDWRACIEAVARLQWATIKRHPWLGSGMSMTRPPLVPTGMAHTDRSLGVLRGLGFDLDTALEIYLAMAGLLYGVAMSLHLEAEAERETGQSYDDWVDQTNQAMDQLRAAERFPHLDAVHDPPDLDRVFDIGLTLILDGLAARLSPPAVPAEQLQKSVNSSRSIPRRAS